MWSNLGDLIHRRIDKAPWGGQVDAARAIAAATQAIRDTLPSELHKDFRVAHLNNGVITIEAAHPSVAHAIQHNTGQILQKLPRGARVNDLRVVFRSQQEGY